MAVKQTAGRIVLATLHLNSQSLMMTFFSARYGQERTSSH